MAISPSRSQPRQLSPEEYVLSKVSPGSHLCCKQHTKLCRPLAVLSDTSPIIRPCLILMSSQSNHRFDREAHPLLCSPHSLVLGIMRNVRRTMEFCVDTMPAICLHDAAIFRLGDLFYNISVISEKCPGLHECNGCVQRFPCCFDNPYRLWVRLCLVANVVCFIQIAMVSTVV